jgi:hypothetical protein
VIIIFKSGELGNQIFQYLAIKKYDNSAWIISFGLDEITEIFDLDLINIPSPKEEDTFLYKIFFKTCLQVLPFFLRLLAQNFRLISTVGEKRSKEGSEFQITNGLFTKIVYFQKVYFQSENTASPLAVQSLKFHTYLLKLASKKLLQFNNDLQNTYFVHIRRGDFINWPNSENPAVVPLFWFYEQIELIKSKNPKATFLIFSNDKPYAKEFFENKSNIFVIEESQQIEFSMMSLCMGGGILSPSTFAWWAARIHLKQSTSPYFVAPLYWIGHRLSQWYPEGVQTSWIDYRPVDFYPKD